MDSILTSIKKQLMIEDDYEQFDQDIIMLINSAFNRLATMGVVPFGFNITDKTSTWQDALGEKVNDLLMAKEYVYIMTRLTFDPPSNSFVLNALKEKSNELLFCLNSIVDHEVQPYIGETQED